MASDRITDEMLIAYAAGELTRTEVERVEAHLAEAPEDAARVERIRATIQAMRTDDSSTPPPGTLARAKAIFRSSETPASPGWLERLERVVANLVFDSRREPALVGVRGADDRYQLAYESEVAEVDLEAVPSPQERILTWTIIGQISPCDPAADIIVALVSHTGRSLLDEARPDPHGAFKLRVGPGVYDLAIRVSDRVLVLQNIALD